MFGLNKEYTITKSIPTLIFNRVKTRKLLGRPGFDRFRFRVSIIVGFSYSCQFIKSFRPFHSFWEEDDLSWEINTNFTKWHIIISWLFSFRVIQLIVRWHTLKTFMFVFINFCSSKNFRDSRLLKYLINKELMIFSNKIQAKTFTWPDMSFYSLHWCAKQRNRTSMLLGELWYTY